MGCKHMKSQRVRQNIGEYKRHLYYQLKKFLIHDPEYNGLSKNAIIAYTLLLDRHRLSVKNKKFVDKNGDIFLIMSRAELQTLLRVSKNTATKVMYELKAVRLLEEVVRGQGKPNLIYMLMPENPVVERSGDDFRIPNNTHLESQKERAQSPTKSDSKLPISTTPSYSNNELSQNESVSLSVSKSKQDGRDETEHKKLVINVDLIAQTEQEIKENISYEDHIHVDESRKALLDEFVTTMLDVIFTENETVRIGGEDKPRTLVKRQYMRLNYEAIERCLDQFESHAAQIKKKPEYIRTMLYNATMETEAHTVNLVNANRGVGVKSENHQTDS